MRAITPLLAAILLWLCATGAAQAETGYDLWLRYLPVEAQYRSQYAVTALVAGAPSPTEDAAVRELHRGLKGLFGEDPAAAAEVTADNVLVLGTPASSRLIAGLKLPLTELGPDGYRIRSVTIAGHQATVIAANSDTGVLYGSFAFLRLIQTRQSLAALDIASAPKTQIRILDHWDNLDGSVERGYAGASIWEWPTLPGHVAPRYIDYARANASIGINGAVLNNVNSNAASLSHEYIEKTAAIAGALRPYGIRVYLSVRWSAPIEIGGLKSADPLDPAVQAWWQAKTDEIYRAIPDFGGFLVKANSEGQPGPAGLSPHPCRGRQHDRRCAGAAHGVVMWRAFVYAERSQGRPRRARPIRSSCRWTANSATMSCCRSRTGRWTSSRAKPFSPAVRRHAQDLADAGIAGHQGISRPADQPGLSGPAL